MSWCRPVQYEYPDEITSDQMFRAYGGNLQEVLVHSAKALFGIMYDLEEVKLEKSVTVEAEGDEEENLLYNWLSNLLIEFEVEEVFFADFSVDIIKRDESKGFHVVGSAQGSHTLPQLRTLVKGITLHRFALKKKNDKYVATVVVDI